MKKNILTVFILSFSVFIFAQDMESNSFGFEDGETKGSDKGEFSVNIGGALHTGFNFFFNSFRSAKKFNEISANLPVWGRLYIEAKAPLTEAFFGVKLSDKTLPVLLGEKAVVFPSAMVPAWIDEAYMQVITGPLIFGGGIKKLSWGRADYMSVLDVVNPMDYSDLSVLELEALKVATPVFYLNAYMPLEMKLSAVYLPVFQPHRLALDGRWLTHDNLALFKDALLRKRTNTPSYWQAGLRYTVTINGYHDIGFQYFYGFLPKPVFKFSDTKYSSIVYNRYHNIGFDYGVALGPVNLRTEFAANITKDLKGDDPSVNNPNLAWNIGLDYTMPYKIMINLQAVETIRLKQKNIRTDYFSVDHEKDLKQTDTGLVFMLSQRLMRGSLEWRIVSTVGIEDKDFLIAPGVHWQYGTLLLDLDLGFFGGKKTGKLGKFKDNHFLKFSMGYKF